MKQVKSIPNHYSSIDDLTLYRWDRYTNTKDNNWFLVDYDGRQSKLNCDELSKVEEQLQDQYFTAVNDRGFSEKMQKWARMDFLISKYRIIAALLDRLYDGIYNNSIDMKTRLQFILELNKWGFIIPELNSVEDDLNRIIELRNALEGIKTQIAMLSNELQSDGKKESNSLHKQLQIIALALGYSYRLDSKQITVIEWIEMCKLLDEKSKQN